ncbi:MAG: hypothetical protein K0R25_155 [Rickettsiaceae bacterium]|jgi:hypothetical protein|nr:hypothetical protein [Rickettsiaceae bacterium]
MIYKLLIFDDELNLTPKVAEHSYPNKKGHEKGQELIIDKRNQIKKNPLVFNGARALFYFKDKELEDGNILKIVPEDYASVLAALELNRNEETIAAAQAKGQFLRPHFVAGVIVLCKTSDDKIIIGSRDANRDKADPTKYPLQFPCGFIDVNEEFYDQMREGNINLLKQAIIGDAKRELREEVLNFNDDEILKTQPLAAIYETKKWPRKEEKGGGTKDVHVIKSFVIEVDVNMTYAEIAEKRAAAIDELKAKLDADPQNKELRQQKKDFDEMTQMGYIDVQELPALLAGKANGTEAEINFDGKPRQFVAEHGMTLDAFSQYFAQRPNPQIRVASAKAVAGLEQKFEER